MQTTDVNSVDKNKGYKTSAKGIALFGGLQIYKILLSVIRTKCSAIFLGPSGFGIYGLISSTLTSIELVTNCGLGTSSVKDIAYAQNDMKEVSRVYLVLNRFVWITGLAATLFCIFGAKYLSISAFGNSDYTIAFVFSAISLLINQLITGQGALLTGMRMYKSMVKLNIWSNTLGVIVTIVLYWLGGVKAIVPVIVSTALLNLVFSFYYAKQIPLPKVVLSLRETWQKGKDMLNMGILISLGGAVTSLAGYITRIFISQMSGVMMVGLFTASFSLVNTYLGMVVSAIDKDYYPRLCSIKSDIACFNKTINQQIEMLVLLLSPIIVLFVIFSPMVIYTFYSEKFQATSRFLVLLALAMTFFVPAKTISMIFLAKGNSKRYFLNQVTFVVYTLLLNMIGFHYGELLGLGISYIGAYMLYLLQTFLTCHHYYQFSFEKQIIIKMCLYVTLAVLASFLSFYATSLIRYTIGTALLVTTSLIAFLDLNSKLDIIKFLRKKL